MRPTVLLLAFLALAASVSSAFGQRRQQQQSNNNRNGLVRGRNIAVVSAEPRNGTIIKQGDSVRLSCRTNIQWFFCVWQGPGGDRQCAIQEKMPQNVCQADNRILLQGSHTNCDIVLKNVKSEDHGDWMCIVTDSVNFNNDKTHIALEVGAPATVKFKQNFGRENVLTITEGETMPITCEALNAHPAPQLSWVEPPDAKVDITAAPEIVKHKQTTDIRHTIKYKAELKDNGREIKCIATQITRDGRTVLYEDTASVKLRVEKLILPIDNALTQKIGIISGVLLAIIFLILLCVFVIFAVCKRRRKRSRPPSSTGTEDTSPEEPPIKPIWTTPHSNGGHPNGGHAPHHHHNHHHRQQHQHLLQKAGGGGLSNTVSQMTVSTQSTSSHASWEDRSVGGEIEDASVQRHKATPPSLHETHFEGSDLDFLPRTVLHHPDPFLGIPTHNASMVTSSAGGPQRTQRPSYAGRPSSSMLEQHPMYNNMRPQSAMDSTPTSMMMPSSRRIPTPNGPMTTSVKSVFDCELGCFVEDDAEDMDSTKPSPSKSEGAGRVSPGSPQSPVSAISRTSEPRDV